MKDVFVALLSILIAVAVSVLVGALSGAIIGLAFSNAFTSILIQIGISNIAMWEFGAFLGFTGSLLTINYIRYSVSDLREGGAL